MWFSAVGVAVNVVASLLLFPVYGVVGIAVATALFGWANAGLLAATLWHRNLFRPSRVTLNRIVLIVAGSALMGAVLWAALAWLEPLLMDAAILIRLVAVLGTIGLGAAIYFAFTLATGAIERRHLLRLLRRRT